MAQQREQDAADMKPLRYSVGRDRPQLTVSLEPGQKIIAEQGAMLRRDESIKPRVILGRSLGLSGTGRGSGQALLTGESIFFQLFENTSDRPQDLVLNPSAIGQILAIDIADFPNGLGAAGGAFFAATPGVQMQVDTSVTWKGLFSGTSIFRQSFSGNGTLFLFAPGQLESIEVTPGTKIVADSDAIFAWEQGVRVDLRRQSLSDMATNGEGVIVADISGSGRAWFMSRGRSQSSSGLLTGGVGQLLGSFIQ